MNRVVHFIYTLGLILSLLPSLASGNQPAKKDYYKTLEVDRAAPHDAIKAARNRLLLQFHTDINPTPEALQRTLDIIEAYSVIGEEGLRAIYDFEVADEPKTAERSADAQEKFSPREIVKRLDAFFPIKRGITTTDLRLAYNFLLSKLGNPEFMIHFRQRNLFYQDVAALLKIATNRVTEDPYPHRGVIAVLLNALIRKRDPIGERWFDEYYSQWENTVESRTPNDPHISMAPFWLELADIVEMKAGRVVPKPSASPTQHNSCRKHLVDRQA